MRTLLYSGLRGGAEVLWRVVRAVDKRFPQNSFQPRWAPAPLLKQKERSFPKLGFPRETDSLCPGCVKEVRAQILSGEADWKVLVDGNPGEIKATIVEEDGRILMRKSCPTHGPFEDGMSIASAFLK